MPELPQRDLTDIAELFNLPEGQRLVILAGTEQRLSGSDRLRLGLEAIHPGRSGILDAYATGATFRSRQRRGGLVHSQMRHGHHWHGRVIVG